MPPVGVRPHGRKPLLHQAPGPQVAPIVAQAVHADLASLILQRTDGGVLNAVPLCYEVPRRPVAEFALGIA